MLTANFEYKALSPDSIRLLELQPSPASASEIHCKVLHKTLSECDADLVEHYIALSYVWGSTDEQQTIYVDGHVFKITRNLFSALRDLRDQSRAVTLWVDAICINQQDIQERNQQVALMAFIYSIARHTVIYLGESSDQIDSVLGRLSGQPSQTTSSLRPSTDTEKLVAKDILARPWFDRVWIFQELVLSRDPWVQCGCCRLKWRSLCDFLTTRKPDLASVSLETKRKGPSEHQGKEFGRLQSLIDARTNYQVGLLQATSELTLMRLLGTRRGVGVTDPRDIIYGHMGIATLPGSTSKEPHKDKGEPFRMLTKPDYAKTIPQVFNDFAYDVLEWSQSFGIFSHIEDVDPSQRRHGSASWAPDWTANPMDDPQRISEYPIENHPKTQDTTSEPSMFQLVPDSYILVAIAKGKEVIQSTSEVIPWDASEIIDIKAYLPRFVQKLDVFGTASSMASEKATHSAWNHIAQLYFEAFLPKTSPPGESYFRLQEPNHGRSALGLALYRTRQKQNEWASIYDLLYWHTSPQKQSSILAQRRIALLESGRYGVVPSSARSGDVISMLTDTNSDYSGGRSATFVFRPCPEIVSTPDNGLEDITKEMIGVIRGYEHGQRLLSEDCGHYRLVGECSLQESAYSEMKGDFHVIALH